MSRNLTVLLRRVSPRQAAEEHLETQSTFRGCGTAILKVHELIRTLEDDGWVLARTRGSHRQFRHPVKPGTVTVAGKPSVEIPIGTLRSALKQAGLLGRKE